MRDRRFREQLDEALHRELSLQEAHYNNILTDNANTFAAKDRDFEAEVARLRGELDNARNHSYH